MQVTYDHTDTIGKNIHRFWFRPPPTIDYIAGQFIELHLPHPNPDERGIKHWFTLSSSPTEELLFITTKFTPEKSSTFKLTLKDLRPGTKVTMVEPEGDFVLPNDANQALIFVAGGIGITPYRSMIKWLQDTQQKRAIQLLYAVNDLDQAVFLDLFKEYGVDLTTIVKQPPADYVGETGSLDAKRILGLIGELNNKLVYVSGPEPMVEQFNDDLQALGVPPSQLKTDFFPNYTSI
ncbi:MAG: hypothetical protein JWS12_718 [Candidatus Saccharibacteria bacterium]|nr:hypothetical protein [Candidatus Saccharibacteria bacterium]